MSTLILTAESKKITLRIYDETPPDPAPDPVLSTLISYKEIKGVNRNTYYEPFYPFELNVSILDLGNDLFYYLKNSEPNRFKCEVEDAESNMIFMGFILPASNSIKFYKKNNVLPLICFDGVSYLRGEMSYSDVTNLDQLLISILQDNLGYNVTLRTIADLYAGGSIYSDYSLARIRVDPAVFVREITEPTNYDLLIALVKAFNLELFHEEGVWYVVEKESLDQVDPDLYQYTDSSQSTEVIDHIITPTTLFRDSGVLEEPEKPTSKITRYVELFDIVFDTFNQNFSFWDSLALRDWEASGNIAEISSQGLEFNDKNPVVSQVIKRSVDTTDNITIDLNGSYFLKTGLEDDQWLFSLAHVRIYNPFTSEERWLNFSDGSWASSITRLGVNLEIDIGESYNTQQSFSALITADNPPIEGFIEMVMELQGDLTALVDVDPIHYDIFDARPPEEMHFNSPYQRALVTNNKSVPTNNDIEKVNLTDFNIYNFENGIWHQTGVDEYEKVKSWGPSSLPLLQYTSEKLASYSIDDPSFIQLSTTFETNPKKYQLFSIEINNETVWVYPIQITRQLNPPRSTINGLILSSSTNYTSAISYLITEPE